MMRKHTRQEMDKASLWMTKAEYNKIIDLSGNLSINSFLRSAVRKAISAAEEEQRQKEEVLTGSSVESQSPTATAIADDLRTNPSQGGPKSNG